MGLLSRLSAVVLLAAFAAGCEPAPIDLVPAEPALTRAAVALDKPPADRARLLLFNGGRYASSGYQARAWPVRVRIDGMIIGGINPNTVMVVDVRPGQYSVAWEELQGRPLAATIVPAALTVTGGELIPLQLDSESWDYKVNRRFQPSQLAPGGPQRLNPDIEVMRPTSCPPTLCL